MALYNIYTHIYKTIIHKKAIYIMTCAYRTIEIDEDAISYSYTMACPPVRGDNPRALASGLSYVQVDNYGITILYHLHQCRPCTSSDISC